jgi:hypothetical protein
MPLIICSLKYYFKHKESHGALRNESVKDMKPVAEREVFKKCLPHPEARGGG